MRITVTTDYSQSVKEYDASGNPAYGNNSASTTFASTLAPYADLTVQSGSLVVQQPSNVQSGNQVTVGWNDQNIGNSAVSTGYTDYVLVQRVNADNSLTYIASGTVAGNSSLGVNATSAQTFSFAMADGASGVGNMRITVTTDYYQTVKEYDASGNPAYGNNSASTTFTSTLANYADLKVQSGSLVVQQPSNVQSGNQVTVGWNDQNVGDAAVSTGYTDYVLVQRVNADKSLTYIASGTVAGNSSLGVNATSAQTFSFTLPDGLAGTGDIRVNVTTDYYQSVKEYDASGNPAYGNNNASLDVTSTLAPYPDLVVQSFGIPANGAPNQPLTLTWSDANQGTKAVPSNAGWDDQVYLADDASGTNKQLLQTFFFSGGIPAEANGTPGTVSHTESVTLPTFVQGNKYILITTGVNESGFYDLRTSSQTTASSNTVYIPPSLLVGLSTHSVPVNASDPDSKGNIPVALTGTVTRTDGTTGALTVTLSSANLTSNNTEVSFPATTVTIPDGQASTTFTVDTVDNRGTDTVQGPQQMQISAAATGHISGSDRVTVTDATVPGAGADGGQRHVLAGRRQRRRHRHGHARHQPQRPQPAQRRRPDRLSVQFQQQLGDGAAERHHPGGQVVGDLLDQCHQRSPDRGHAQHQDHGLDDRHRHALREALRQWLC